MNPKELTTLAERYRSMSTEDLVKAASADRHEYQEEALELIDKELAARNVTIEQKEEVKAKITRIQSSQDRQITGVRGWLLVFVVLLALNSLLAVAGGFFVVLKESQGFLDFLIRLPYLLLGCYGFLVVVLLIGKTLSAPDHARRLLITSLVYALFTDLSSLVFSGIHRHPEFTASKLVPYVAIGIWLAYLKQSRRVALTYRIKDDSSNQTVERTGGGNGGRCWSAERSSAVSAGGRSRPRKPWQGTGYCVLRRRR